MLFYYLINLLRSFGFKGPHELYLSLFSSVKYQLSPAFIVLASIWGYVEILLGLKHLTIIAFISMLALELVTGLIASRIVKKQRIKAARFDRFLIKLVFWLICFFIIHSFSQEYKESSDYLYTLYVWLHAGFMMYAAGQNLISSLENFSVITGNSTSRLINAINQKIDAFLGPEKTHSDEEL